MSIICFEGASAVGKTTTANRFKAKYGAFVVPEVNHLFNRPANESPVWYFERQVERWAMAQEHSKNYDLVILDGDPFQPLWYNWSYHFDGWQGLEFIEQFYRLTIQNKTIGFPDLYFVFSIDEDELRKRKSADWSRQRRSFETHLKMIEPQRRYFHTMQVFSPDRVQFIEAKFIETNIADVRQRVSVLSKPGESESVNLFNEITQWLRENEA